MNPEPPSAITIRPAVPADAALVGALFASHLAALGVEPDPRLDADMVDFPAGYAGAGNEFLVAETAAGAVVGMVGLLEAEVRRLHVQGSWRRFGLGRRLVMTVIERATLPPGSVLRAVVERNNEPSRCLFRACGFVATGVAPADPFKSPCEIFVRAALAAASPDFVNRVAA